MLWDRSIIWWDREWVYRFLYPSDANGAFRLRLIWKKAYRDAMEWPAGSGQWIFPPPLWHLLGRDDIVNWGFIAH